MIGQRKNIETNNNVTVKCMRNTLLNTSSWKREKQIIFPLDEQRPQGMTNRDWEEAKQRSMHKLQMNINPLPIDENTTLMLNAQETEVLVHLLLDHCESKTYDTPKQLWEAVGLNIKMELKRSMLMQLIYMDNEIIQRTVNHFHSYFIKLKQTVFLT